MQLTALYVAQGGLGGAASFVMPAITQLLTEIHRTTAIRAVPRAAKWPLRALCGRSDGRYANDSFGSKADISRCLEERGNRRFNRSYKTRGRARRT